MLKCEGRTSLCKSSMSQPSGPSTFSARGIINTQFVTLFAYLTHSSLPARSFLHSQILQHLTPHSIVIIMSRTCLTAHQIFPHFIPAHGRTREEGSNWRIRRLMIRSGEIGIEAAPTRPSRLELRSHGQALSEVRRVEIWISISHAGQALETAFLQDLPVAGRNDTVLCWPREASPSR